MIKCVSGHEAADCVALASRCHVLYLSTSSSLQWGEPGPVPFLGSTELAELSGRGWLMILCKSKIQARALFEQIIGDDGPTATNPYDGPHRVYAYLTGPRGGITENT